ncbi:MAG: EutN/CcmL family microcompartment protein [Candidatus Sericytochromatia bacterium]|nr:EutN/CcmL family microcompartment protein [Candidatus Sericytochromatia bacterium]
MLLAKVTGTVVATLKHPDLEGHKLMQVQPIQPDGSPKGAAFVAIDLVQAGPGATVLVAREGGSARIAVGKDDAPVHAVILGIVDAVAGRPVTT